MLIILDFQKEIRKWRAWNIQRDYDLSFLKLLREEKFLKFLEEKKSSFFKEVNYIDI